MVFIRMSGLSELRNDVGSNGGVILGGFLQVVVVVISVVLCHVVHDHRTATLFVKTAGEAYPRGERVGYVIHQHSSYIS